MINEVLQRRYMALGQRAKELRAELDTITRAGLSRQPFRAVFDLCVLERKIAEAEHERDALFLEMQRILKGDPR